MECNIENVKITYESGKSKDIDSGLLVSVENLNGYNKVMNLDFFGLTAEEKRDICINLIHVLGKQVGIIDDIDYED